MASLIRSILHFFVATLQLPPPPQQLPAVADDLLEEIFLRIGSFADLARASTACATFRRLIANRSFLRRYRSLHPPLLLGFLYAEPAEFQRAEAPHPNAPAAHVLACAAGFSFDYLPLGTWGRWDPCDVRDGRVLLKSIPAGYTGVVLADLAVCDPVSQEYLLLPPIPDDLLASVQVQEQNLQCFEPFLVPSGDDEDETSFEVMGRTYCATKTVIFVFSRCSDSWIVGTSTSWDALSLNLIPGDQGETYHYAYGCFFWRLGRGNKLLKLAMNKMEFSIGDLPPVHNEGRIVVAEAGDGRLAMFSQTYPGASVYYFTSMQNEGEGAYEWQMESMIPLPSNYKCSIKGAAEGYIFLVGTSKGRDTLRAVCFSLEIKTLKIERVSRIRYGYCYFYPYFGFPPSMSPRRI
ncbi:uncharacterized protein LOC133891901 [Phragmites australis]|uniref:uncharacterized protein LOC133891901 n=1 Tax=Phragmites australis TaxID=29695 RepID=UPI002D79464B|nr:uncharacterized protein LOC133891901 [Phragmites australis]XP_062188588.1 uncharacterized protein LOC133891901 [Phragmites australis]XP_062188589.1 uncharacterized protein LOC133891901 [Phragmites australis]